MKIRIIARAVTIAELQPGDLWSFHGPEHWDKAMNTVPGTHFAALYIRNNRPEPKHMSLYPVYHITIERNDDA